MNSKMTYDELVARGREVVSQQDDLNWELGDLSLLAIKANREKPSNQTDKGAAIRTWANDIGWEGTIGSFMMIRHTASAWPKKHRCPGVSWSAHRELNSFGERFAVIRPGMTIDEARVARGMKARMYHDHGRPLTVLDGIKRLQSAESWIKSAGRVDYDKATEEELEMLGECWNNIEQSGQSFLEASGMVEYV